MTTTAVRSIDIADLPPRPVSVIDIYGGNLRGIEATVYAAAWPLAVRARSISPEASRFAAEATVAATARFVAAIGDPVPASVELRAFGVLTAGDVPADLAAPFWRDRISDEHVENGAWALAVAVAAEHATDFSRNSALSRATEPPVDELRAALKRFNTHAADLTRLIDGMAPA